MRHIYGIVRIHQQFDGIFHLRLVSVIKFIERFHLLYISCLQPDLDAFIHPV